MAHFITFCFPIGNEPSLGREAVNFVGSTNVELSLSLSFWFWFTFLALKEMSWVSSFFGENR